MGVWGWRPPRGVGEGPHGVGVDLGFAVAVAVGFLRLCARRGQPQPMRRAGAPRAVGWIARCPAALLADAGLSRGEPARLARGIFAPGLRWHRLVARRRVVPRGDAAAGCWLERNLAVPPWAQKTKNKIERSEHLITCGCERPASGRRECPLRWMPCGGARSG